MTLESDLLEFINAEVRLDQSVAVVGDTDLLLTGLVDSVGVIEIVGWLEDETGIDVDPLEVVLANFQTVDRMIDLVNRVRRTTATE